MKLKIAVAGTGFIGKQHIGAIRACHNLELCGVVSSNPETIEKMKAVNVPVFKSIAELCQNTDADIVDICTPTFMHEQNITEAAGFGKNIICEKPVTIGMDSFKRIKNAVSKAGIRFMAAQVLRFFPEYIYIKDLYDAAEFGTIRHCSAKRICETPNWSAWFTDEEKSGGTLYDLMIHDLDFVQYLFGDVESVYAVGNNNARSRSFDYISVSIKFKNAVSCTVESSERAFGAYPFTAEMHIFGDDMALDYELKAGHNLDEPSSSSVYTYKAGENPKLQNNIRQSIPIENELDYFADCLINNRAFDKCTIQSTEKTIMLLEAVKQSLSTKELVRL